MIVSIFLGQKYILYLNFLYAFVLTLLIILYPIRIIPLVFHFVQDRPYNQHTRIRYTSYVRGFKFQLTRRFYARNRLKMYYFTMVMNVYNEGNQDRCIDRNFYTTYARDKIIYMYIYHSIFFGINLRNFIKRKTNNRSVY